MRGANMCSSVDITRLALILFCFLDEEVPDPKDGLLVGQLQDRYATDLDVAKLSQDVKQDSHSKLSDRIGGEHNSILSSSPAANELITSKAVFIKHFPRSGAINYRQATLFLPTYYQFWIQ